MWFDGPSRQNTTNIQIDGQWQSSNDRCVGNNYASTAPLTEINISTTSVANISNFRNGCINVTGGTGTGIAVASGATLSISNYQAINATGYSVAGLTNAGTVYDLGGNKFNGPLINSGSWNASGHVINGACTGVATASSTLGLFGTGPNVTVTTCTTATIGSGIVMHASVTLQGLFVTASTAGVNASSGVVTVLKNGSATAITCTIGTGTSCNDSTHTVAAVAGDLISINFTTQAADTLAGVKAQVETF
jgi:hypothetical protein